MSQDLNNIGNIGINPPLGEGLKASYFTLGCKLNYAETSTIGKTLSEMGIRRAQKGERPDICVVNTCSVTEMADKKGRALLRRLHREYPEATIVATGCYVQLKPREAAGIDGVDIVLGNDEKLRIGEYLGEWLRSRSKVSAVTEQKEIREFRGSCERGDRTRFWLKVQDGCDYFCSYCTIPFARGRSRSGLTEDLVAQARQAAETGGKEIVITGVNIGCFGQDTGEDLLELLKRLDAVDGIERYRISSIEPNLLTEEIIRWTSEESRAFMPHFHIPLQSGSDAVLRIMRRRYDTALFASRIELIRSLMPEAFVGVDVIAGARGETREEWVKSRDFIKSLDVTRLHVFPYSERPGTMALRLDGKVSQEEKHLRAAELGKISARKLLGFMESLAGETRTVLWEHPIGQSGLMTGLTDNYIRVNAPLQEELLNTVTPTLLEGICGEETMKGRPLPGTNSMRNAE